ncbi:MAG TPA: hypothetical protein VF903_10570 [Nitrospirota bacterium]
MNRIAPLLALTALLFTFTACGGKKPPEQTAVMSKNVLSAVRDLGKSYEKKDLSSFMAGVSSGYQDRDGFSKSVAAVFSKYETIHFNIQYTKMLIMAEEQGQVRASFNWDADWLTAGGTTQKDGGRVTLVFERGTFKLVSINGKNPFLAQPGETPGSK